MAIVKVHDISGLLWGNGATGGTGVAQFFQTTAPTTRVDGTALQTGDLWYNPVNGVNASWDSSDWVCKKYLMFAVSDEQTNLQPGTEIITFRMPYACRLLEARSNVKNAPTGSSLIVDVNQNSASILTQQLTIDPGEKTSVSSTAPAIISTPLLADDAEMSIDIDQVGATNPGKGLKMTFIVSIA